MPKTETLTAYKCSFSYLQRKNPLHDELRDAIKAGEKPKYNLSDFFRDYHAISSEMAIGENTDRAISISFDEIVTENIGNGIYRTHLKPLSGKQGKPLTVKKTSTKKVYNFGSDSAALYPHHTFLYECNDSIIAIFHRQNGSGCKSVFLETANNALRSKGIKLEMDLLMPTTDSSSNGEAVKIILKNKREIQSSDIADRLKNKKPRDEISRELSLNLKSAENNIFYSIYRSMQLGDISKEDAFVKIVAACSDDYEYNDAEVQVKFGKKRRTIKWNDCEHFLGSHDISEPLSAACKKPEDFIPNLIKLSDEYYNSIIESEVC